MGATVQRRALRAFREMKEWADDLVDAVDPATLKNVLALATNWVAVFCAVSVLVAIVCVGRVGAHPERALAYRLIALVNLTAAACAALALAYCTRRSAHNLARRDGRAANARGAARDKDAAALHDHPPAHTKVCPRCDEAFPNQAGGARGFKCMGCGLVSKRPKLVRLGSPGAAPASPEDAAERPSNAAAEGARLKAAEERRVAIRAEKEHRKRLAREEAREREAAEEAERLELQRLIEEERERRSAHRRLLEEERERAREEANRAREEAEAAKVKAETAANAAEMAATEAAKARAEAPPPPATSLAAAAAAAAAAAGKKTPAPRKDPAPGKTGTGVKVIPAPRVVVPAPKVKPPPPAPRPVPAPKETSAALRARAAAVGVAGVAGVAPTPKTPPASSSGSGSREPMVVDFDPPLPPMRPMQPAPAWGGDGAGAPVAFRGAPGARADPAGFNPLGSSSWLGMGAGGIAGLLREPSPSFAVPGGAAIGVGVGSRGVEGAATPPGTAVGTGARAGEPHHGPAAAPPPPLPPGRPPFGAPPPPPLPSGPPPANARVGRAGPPAAIAGSTSGSAPPLPPVPHPHAVASRAPASRSLRGWLASLGLDGYASNFERERISMADVPLLTEGDLERLGLPLGPRRRVAAAANPTLGAGAPAQDAGIAASASGASIESAFGGAGAGGFPSGGMARNASDGGLGGASWMGGGGGAFGSGIFGGYAGDDIGTGDIATSRHRRGNSVDDRELEDELMALTGGLNLDDDEDEETGIEGGGRSPDGGGGRSPDGVGIEDEPAESTAPPPAESTAPSPGPDGSPPPKPPSQQSLDGLDASAGVGEGALVPAPAPKPGTDPSRGEDAAKPPAPATPSATTLAAVARVRAAAAKGHQCPSEYFCPITQDVICDPVIAWDGHTYERVSIARWLEEHATSPMTGETLQDRTLRPNHSMRSQIIGYGEKLQSEGLCD